MYHWNGAVPFECLILERQEGGSIKRLADGEANPFLIGSPEKTEHELNNEFPVYYVCFEKAGPSPTCLFRSVKPFRTKRMDVKERGTPAGQAF
jgi:hypothetical protein